MLVGCSGGGENTWTTGPPVTGETTTPSANTGGVLPPPATCNVTITWEAPYDRIDGTPITTEELEKYTIYISHQEDTKPSTLITIVDVTDTDLITFEIKGLSKGQKYFYMTVTDTEHRESTFSNILNKLC